MSDACEPGVETSRLFVASLSQGNDDLDESLLKDVVSHVVVTNNIEDVVVEFLLITLKQFVKGFIVSRHK